MPALKVPEFKPPKAPTRPSGIAVAIRPVAPLRLCSHSPRRGDGIRSDLKHLQAPVPMLVKAAGESRLNTVGHWQSGTSIGRALTQGGV